MTTTWVGGFFNRFIENSCRRITGTQKFPARLLRPDLDPFSRMALIIEMNLLK
jgi:hypothetical protein